MSPSARGCLELVIGERGQSTSLVSVYGAPCNACVRAYSVKCVMHVYCLRVMSDVQCLSARRVRYVCNACVQCQLCNACVRVRIYSVRCVCVLACSIR